ncbi:hypothetical protein [Geothrix sp. 21YS21S-4]|uniref:hypothetical protein n=1 Tax=Geothrix sp. 21YS21S-4 TaxID=3068889 RepID=UPI0027B9A17C|nr:hypothetical protein [Geothrix sp. 21YS21S-4]
MTRHLGMAALLLAAGAGLRAQDAWDPVLKLTLSPASDKVSDHLGGRGRWGIGVEGSYWMARKAQVVVEGGYTTQNSADATVSDVQSLSFGTQGFYGGVLYRYTDFKGAFEGAYVQGGLRYFRLRSTLDQYDKAFPTDASPARTTFRGDQVTTLTPVLGVGFRFNDKISVEVSAYRLKTGGLQFVDTQWTTGEKSTTTFECALGIHL